MAIFDTCGIFPRSRSLVGELEVRGQGCLELASSLTTTAATQHSTSHSKLQRATLEYLPSSLGGGRGNLAPSLANTAIAAAFQTQPERELNEIEASNLSEPKYKVMVFRMLIRHKKGHRNNEKEPIGNEKQHS